MSTEQTSMDAVVLILSMDHASNLHINTTDYPLLSRISKNEECRWALIKALVSIDEAIESARMMIK